VLFFLHLELLLKLYGYRYHSIYLNWCELALNSNSDFMVYITLQNLKRKITEWESSSETLIKSFVWLPCKG